MSRFAVLAFTLLFSSMVLAQPAGRVGEPDDEALRQRAAGLSRRGAQFLLAAQEQDGGWTSQGGPGITCLALKALIQEPTVGPNHDSVRRGVDFVRRFIRGRRCLRRQSLRADPASQLNFAALRPTPHDTATAPTAPKRTDGGPSAVTRPGSARRSLRSRNSIENQWDEAEGKSIDDPWYGGSGMAARSFVLNTQMMLDASS